MLKRLITPTCDIHDYLIIGVPPRLTTFDFAQRRNDKADNHQDLPVPLHASVIVPVEKMNFRPGGPNIRM